MDYIMICPVCAFTGKNPNKEIVSCPECNTLLEPDEIPVARAVTTKKLYNKIRWNFRKALLLRLGFIAVFTLVFFILELMSGFIKINEIGAFFILISMLTSMAIGHFYIEDKFYRCPVCNEKLPRKTIGRHTRVIKHGVCKLCGFRYY